jgi:hypothetical protein
VKCFLGTITTVSRHDGVVEGGTGVMELEKTTGKKTISG